MVSSVRSGLERAAIAFDRAYGHFAGLLDEHFVIQWVSTTTEQIFGWSDLVGRNMTELIHPDDLDLVAQAAASHREFAEDYRGMNPMWKPILATVRVATADGAWILVEAETFNFLSDPDIAAVLATGRVGSDRMDLAHAIDLIIDSAPIEEVLPTVTRLVDGLLDGCRCQFVWWDEDDHPVVVRALDSTPLPDPPTDLIDQVRRSGERSGAAALGLDDDPGAVPFDRFQTVWAMPVHANSDNEVLGCLVVWNELPMEFVTAPQQLVYQGIRLAALAIADHHAKRTLRWDAAHDPLTGVLNRAGLESALEEADGAVGVLYVDLDDFKPINDGYGHETGDQVLTETAARICDEVRTVDFVARFGGDEFVVLCPGPISTMQLESIGERIVASLRTPMQVGSEQLRVGASVGAAIGTQHDEWSDTLQRSDEALYRAKEAGKSTVVVDRAGSAVET